MGSPARDAPWGIQVDQLGDVVITAFYEGAPATIEGTAMNFIDGSEFFLAKYDQEGDLKWVVDFTGLGFDRGDQVVIDKDNQIYLGGLFTDSLFISTAPEFPLVSSGGSDVFLSKFDESGNLLWTHTFGGPAADICYGLCVDEGELLVVGHFVDTIQTGLNGDTLSSKGGQDAYLASFDIDGTYNWIRSYGGSGHDRAYDVAKDQEGNQVMVGYFSDTAYFDTIELIALNGFDGFVSKTDSIGQVLWAVGFPSPGGNEQIRELTLDPKGNIYVAGYFEESVNFAGNSFTATPGNAQAYVLALNPFGEFLWAETSDGPSNNFLWDIDFRDDRLLAVGAVTNSLQWGGQTHLLGTSSRGIITVLDLQGNVLQTHILGSDQSEAIRFFESAWGDGDQVFISAMVDEGGIIGMDTIPGLGNTDIVVGRFTLAETTSSSPSLDIEASVNAWYSNTDQELHLYARSTERTKYVLATISGQILLDGIFEREATYSMQPFPTGIYIVSFETSERIYSQKFVHQK